MKETIRIEKDSLIAYVEFSDGTTETSAPLVNGFDATMWVNQQIDKNKDTDVKLVHAGYRYVANALFF